MKSIITQFPVAGKHFPSAECATAANLVRRDADIFSKQIKTETHFYSCSIFSTRDMVLMI